MKILQTILQPPQTDGILIRNDLLDQIWDHREKKLIFIKAGPGYGKTMLTASYYHMVKRKIWLSIPKGFISFFELCCHMAAALDQLIDTPASNRLIATCHKMQTEELIVEIINLVNDHVQEEMHIFIDDFDHLLYTEKNTLQMIELLVNFLPLNVHLVITSHVDLPIPIATLSKNANFYQLSQNNLKFSLDELRRLFMQNNISIPVSALYTLYQLSDGWILVIILFLSQFKNSGDQWQEILEQTKIHTGDYIDYFLQTLSADDLDFFQKVSFFDKIDASFCNEFLKRDDCRELLNRLASMNLLNKYDRDVFQIHQLIKKKLQKRFAPSVLQEHYANLAELYLAKERTKDAIFYLLKSDQIERAEKLILEITSTSIKDTVSMQHWLDELPENVISHRPYLVYYRGQIKEKIGQFDKALEDYQQARQLFASVNQQKEATMAGVQLIGIHWHKREFDQTIRMIQEMLPTVLPTDYGALATLHNIWGTSLLEKFQRDEGVNHLLQAIEYCQLSGDTNFEGWILNNLVYWAYIPTGQVDLAIQTYQKALEIFQKNNDLPGQRLIMLNLCNLYLRTGHIQPISEMLQQIEEIILNNNNLAGNKSFFIIRARYFILANELNQALDDLETIGELHELNDFQQTQTYLTYSYYHTALGQYDQALIWVERALEVTSFASNYLYNEFYIQKLQLKYLRGELNEALELANQIIEQIEQPGYQFYLAEALFFKTVILKTTKNEYQQELVHFLQILRECNLGFILKKYSYLTKNLKTELEKRLNERGDLQEILKESVKLYQDKDSIQPKTSNSLLRIWMYGQFKLYTKQGYILNEEWRNKKAANILKYLVLNRHQWIPQEQIIDLFWPKADVDKAKQSLYVALYTIRKKLEPDLDAPRDSHYILSQHGHLKFNTSQPYWLDINEFDKYYQEAVRLCDSGLEQKSEEFLTMAKDLYEQELLPENIYDDWSIEHRRVYQKHYLDLLLRLVRYQQKKDVSQAKVYIEEILKIDPYHHKANLWFLDRYIAKQEFEKARLYYEQLEKLFKAELDVELPDEFRKRFKQL